jgi:hypothetical protein
MFLIFTHFFTWAGTAGVALALTATGETRRPIETTMADNDLAITFSPQSSSKGVLGFARAEIISLVGSSVPMVVAGFLECATRLN